MSFGEQVYRHATYGSIRNWRERGGRYRLDGSRCAACGEAYFPRRICCLKCNSRQMEHYECARHGTVIVAWQQVGIMRLLGYADLPPRFVAIIRLDDGVHLEAELIDVSEEQVNSEVPGMRVRMVLRKIKPESNGNWCYGYKFTPLEASAAPQPEGQAIHPQN